MLYKPKAPAFGVTNKSLHKEHKMDNLTRTASHLVFLGLADSLFDISEDETLETLVDSLHDGTFELEDTVRLIAGTFDFLGASESLMDDMFSDDEDISRASLKEVAELAVDNFEKETVESFADILQDHFLEDWKTFKRSGHFEGEKRTAAGGEKHVLVKSHVGKTPTFTSVPVDGKGKKPRGKSSTRKRSSELPNR